MGRLIQKHRGRVVHGSGDSLLAEFVSVVNAVSCAVEIQKELRTNLSAELSYDISHLFSSAVAQRLFLFKGGFSCLSRAVHSSKP